MKIHAVCSRYIVFSLPPDCRLDEKNAESFIRRLLKENDLPQWNSICFDIFNGLENSLYLAYPKTELKITFAPYALPFLEEYFTE